MALGLNEVLLIGTLVRPPDLRYTPRGTAVLRLDVAGDERVFDEHGDLRVRPWYQRATLFGEAAERLADDVHVGTAVWLLGVLQQRRWEDDDGSHRSSLDVIVRRAERLTYGGRDPAMAVTLDVRDQPRLLDSVNTVRVIGNATRDAEVSVPEGGTPLARFAVAVTASQGRDRGGALDAPDRSGEARAEVVYVEVRAWRDLALSCQGVHKGTPIFVEGRLTTDAWTDAKGAKRWATRVEVRRLEWIEPPATHDARFQPPVTGERPARASDVSTPTA